MFNLRDLDRTHHFDERDKEMVFINLWREIHKTLNLAALYLPVGTIVDIREHDFLVTTPVAKVKEHAKEAEDSIRHFMETGHIDYYYRDCYSFPRNLKIGSKFFYVDNRAIRGFAVVTDIDIANINANMNVDTWRWIDPIPCDYGKLKPPQKYARAIGHQYLRGVGKVQVIGEWLDPMPQK